MKNITMIEPPLSIKSTVKENNIEEIKALAEKIAESMCVKCS